MNRFGGGWILRNSIVWNKPNAMPSSVRDRFANKYEPVFMLVKNKKYHFDLDAVRIPQKYPEDVARRIRQDKEAGVKPFQKGDPISLHIKGPSYFNYRVRDSEKKLEQCPQFKATKEKIERYKKETGKIKGGGANLNLPYNPITGGKIYKKQTSIPQDQAESFGSSRARYWREVPYHPSGEPSTGHGMRRPPQPNQKGAFNIMGKNPGDVWTIPTQPCPADFRGVHFAIFPEKLIEPMILSSCPAQICKRCGKARERITKKEYRKSNGVWGKQTRPQKEKGEVGFRPDKNLSVIHQTIGFTKCNCENPEYEPGICLDPFCGLGTVGVVAKRLGKNFIGIDIKKKYCEMAEERIRRQAQPIL